MNQDSSLPGSMAYRGAQEGEVGAKLVPQHGKRIWTSPTWRTSRESSEKPQVPVITKRKRRRTDGRTEQRSNVSDEAIGLASEKLAS